MKWMIASDIHGSEYYCKKMLEAFDREEVDPYVYCFDADDFGVTYHRFARVDYEKLTQ